MALQTSGPISLSEIASEFSDAPPHQLSEFFGVAGGIPIAGQISFGQFYGASSAFELTLSNNTQNANIHTLAVAAGWDQLERVRFIINTGVYVWSDDTALPALDMGGVFPGGLELINKGFVMGKGGNGASIGSNNNTPATAGGPAINLTGPIEIDNAEGYIGGGGGGGATSTQFELFGNSLGLNSLAPGGGGAGGGLGGTNGGQLPPPAPAPGQAGTQTVSDDPTVLSQSNMFLQPAPPASAGGATGGHIQVGGSI